MKKTTNFIILFVFSFSILISETNKDKNNLFENKKITALQLQYQKDIEKFNLLSNKKKSKLNNIAQTKNINPPLSSAQINRYTNMSNIDLSLSDGNIVLSSTIADKFSVNSVGSLNLTMQDVSTLNVKNEIVTLKSGDIINIIGKNNVINVSNTFNIDGSLLFDADSQLTVNLTTDCAQVVLGSNLTLDLESNVELKFSGAGSVIFENGASINLKGTISSPTLYPSFILDNFASFSPDSSATVTIKGVGNIIVQNGAILDVRGYGNTKHLYIGNAESDDIDVLVKGKAMIRVDGGTTPYRSANSYAPPSGNYGSISFAKGKYSLTAKQGGIVFIGSGGWIEINSLLADPTLKGQMKKMDFGPDGNFCLSSGGLLSFSENNYESSTQLKTIWIGDDALIFGDNAGQVEFVAKDPKPNFTYQGFIGTFNPTGFAFKNTAGLIPAEIARALIN